MWAQPSKSAPTATRVFFKDVLQWPFISEEDRGDAGTGVSGTGGTDPAEWLIFATGPSEPGVHPTMPEGHEAAARGRPNRAPREIERAVGR